MATFKARARALDMLGRQQIAGIPTAISELFKNAHDAYAENVVVDYYRSDRLFVLRDDGIGMTQDDFENRWLALGTESKLALGIGLPPPPSAAGKPVRPILGEKGIGRLAIAAIGPQVLILTRAKRDNILSDLVVAFIHWGAFEGPGLDLGDIDIPSASFTAGNVPDRGNIQQLVDRFRSNIQSLGKRLPTAMAERILSDLQRFDCDPKQIDSWLGQPSLGGEGHGTHFIILPADESLTVEIDTRRDDDPDTASPLVKALIGFANTMTPGHQPPVMATSFRYHRTEETWSDLIDEQEFFTPEEFENADHHFQGLFDDHGQFRGTISVYGQETSNYIAPWSGGGGGRTDCGPFRFDLAYVAGRNRESTLPAAQWIEMNQKLSRYGGLYIYRDGIRVLPYGDSDFDFLDIEKRRTKSAGYYYFSYRRMFGVVQLTRHHNAELNEKAGREGFRQNKAYREFRSILANFFVQVAADFFREGGAYATHYEDARTELERIELARRKREKQAAGQRQALQIQLDIFFHDIDSGLPQQESSDLVKELKYRLEAAKHAPTVERAAEEVLEAERWGREMLTHQREKYRIPKPSGLGLSKNLRRDWDAYQDERRKLHETLFQPLADEIFLITAQAAKEADLLVDRRLRLRRIIEERGGIARDAVKRDIAENVQRRREAFNNVRSVVAQCRAEVEDAIHSAEAYLNTLDVDRISDAELQAQRAALDNEITNALDRNHEIVDRITNQLASLASFRVNATDESVDLIDTQAANEEEILALRDQVAQNLELAQLGAALSVVEHEFGAVVRDLRTSLRSLRPYADANRKLKPLYNNLTTTFESLDAYLKLFVPLQRRLYRDKVKFYGSDIETFLKNLFVERFRRHNIRLIGTPAFRVLQITGYPSTFYPVSVNLVDNAIHWCTQPRVSDPWIQLDADGDNLLITDSGPGVSIRDRQSIFEFGFTRKPGGRGIGLYIARRALEHDGYNIEIEDAPTGRGTQFRIAPTTLAQSDGVDIDDDIEQP